MHFLHVINSDSVRLLNVFGQIATFWEIIKSRMYSRCLSYYNMFCLLLCLWKILTISSRLDLFWWLVMLLRPYHATISNMRSKSGGVTSGRHYVFLLSGHQFHSFFFPKFSGACSSPYTCTKSSFLLMFFLDFISLLHSPYLFMVHHICSCLNGVTPQPVLLFTQPFYHLKAILLSSMYVM